MIKTTTLSGAEQKVEFAGNHTHYWIQNLSDSDVLASMSSGITEGADNVLTIPAGGVSYVRDDKGASSVYLLGTGKVQIYGKSNEFCPFKSASGGGGSGGGSTGQNYITQMGYVTGVTGSGGKETVLTFETPFAETPYVFISPVDNDSGTNSHAEVRTATATGCTIYVFQYEGANWIAFGTPAN